MELHLTARDQHNQYREFFCQLEKLEFAFDLLSDIVAQGSTLIQAHILEDGQRTDLPLVVFDGEPFLKAMQELESDWQSLLMEPTHSIFLANDPLFLLIQQRADLVEARMAVSKKMIRQLEDLLQRTNRNFMPGPLKLQAISRYETMITRNRVWLLKDEISQQVILNRLGNLAP